MADNDRCVENYLFQVNKYPIIDKRSSCFCSKLILGLYGKSNTRFFI